MRERRLFDREKRAHFVATGTNHTDRTGNYQKNEVARAREGEPRGGHQNGSHDQHAPPSHTVGACREIERDDGIADERQREKNPGLRFAQANADQVENQDDR